MPGHRYICDLCRHEKSSWEHLLSHLMSGHQESSFSERMHAAWIGRDPSYDRRDALQWFLEMMMDELIGILEDRFGQMINDWDYEAPDLEDD